MSEQKIPAENMSLWKLVLLTYLVLAPWVIIATLIPMYSQFVLFLGISLSTIGAIGTALVKKGHTRKGHIALGNGLFLLFMIIGARGWYSILGRVYIWLIWMAVLFSMYVFAWMLPRYNPKLSEFLFREQYTPETRLGKIILNASAKFLPIAGASGALFGMYASRDGTDSFGMIFMGIAGTLLSIAFAQLTAHQFWMEDRQQEAHTMEAE